MRYIDPAVVRDLDKFRIVDASGKEVGEYWGNDPKKGLIFESKSRWDSLNGLYLDGFGHREPLVPASRDGPVRESAIVTAPLLDDVVRPRLTCRSLRGGAAARRGGRPRTRAFTSARAVSMTGLLLTTAIRYTIAT